MKKKYLLNEIWGLNLNLKKNEIIFLYWDLWAGKTTISKHILNNLLWVKEEIRSPTYTYYNKYLNNYHFDLYRLQNYDDFFAIWWEEILDNNSWIIIIEWPELIEKYFSPTIKILLNKTENEKEREIEIIRI